MAIGSTWSAEHGTKKISTAPAVRRIDMADLRDALRRGWQDLTEQRTDVLFLGLIYPAVGLILARMALGYGVLPVIFPLAAGFALIGPFAGTGLYLISKRRGLGEEPSWRDAFGIFRLPNAGAIMLLGLGLGALFVLWLEVATVLWQALFADTVGASVGAFLHAVFATRQGWELIIVGNAIGFAFALAVLVLSVMSFPLLVDRETAPGAAEQLSIAVGTSIRAVRENPGPMLAWGLIVALALLAGSIPFFVGLIVVMPWLGHATWHLYRKVVV